MLLVVVWWCQICSTNFPKSFFHAFDDYIKNIDILKIHHLKKNFYSIVQLQPIRNIFSLRPIIKSRNFFRFIQDCQGYYIFLKNLSISILSTRIGFVVGFFFLGNRGEAELSSGKGSNGDESIPDEASRLSGF